MNCKLYRQALPTNRGTPSDNRRFRHRMRPGQPLWVTRHLTRSNTRKYNVSKTTIKKAPMGVHADGGLENVFFKIFGIFFKNLLGHFGFSVGFLAVFCVGSTDFHPKRCLGARFWARTKFWKIMISRPPSAWTPIGAFLTRILVFKKAILNYWKGLERSWCPPAPIQFVFERCDSPFMWG